MPKMQQNNPVVSMVQHQLDASMELAHVLFSGTEKIDRAVLDATHHVVDDHFKFARAVTNLQDSTRLEDLKSTLVQRPEHNMQCQQQIMSAFVEMQAEFSRSLQYYMERLNEAASSQVTNATHAQTVTRGADGNMFNPVTSMMAVWESAFRQASNLANRNMLAARSTMENVANASGEAASHAAHAAHEIEIEESEHTNKKHSSVHRKK